MTRIGILGHGYMGTIRHRVLAARGDCEVGRIFHTETLPPEHAALAAPSWQDVVDDPGLDAVVVCLPNDLTTEATCRALSTGKHVFAEKPPGRTVAEAVAMAEAAREADRVLQFGFNHRWHPAFRALGDRVAALGRPVWLRGVYGKPREPDFDRGWRADVARAGGGILLDQGIHLLDLVRSLCGRFVRVEASAVGRPLESELVAVLEDANGAVASVHSSQSQWPPRFSLEVGLTGGTVAMTGLLSRSGRYGPETLSWRDAATGEVGERVYAVDDSWALELEAWLAGCRGEGEVSVGSPDEAVELMRLVADIYASAGSPRVVH